MNSFTDPLAIELFGLGADIDIEVSPEVPDLDKIVAAIDEKQGHSWAGNQVVKKIAFEDFCKDFLDFVPAVEPAELPSEVGAIPSTRPKTKPSAQRRKKIREMVTDCGIEVNQYTREAIESLIVAMESYVDNQVRA